MKTIGLLGEMSWESEINYNNCKRSVFRLKT